MYEVGRILGFLIGGFGLFSLVRFIVKKIMGLATNGGEIREMNMRNNMSYSQHDNQPGGYEDLCRKVDWLINQQTMQNRQFSEPPIEVYPYYYHR